MTGGVLPFDPEQVPSFRIGGVMARPQSMSSRRLVLALPPGVSPGVHAITVDGQPEPLGHIHVGAAIATGLHQVDNPVYDREGNLYATFSGTRGQQVPVSVFRVRPDGGRESLVTGIVNATSLAFDEAGRLHVSSRFDGCIYRIAADGTPEKIASELGAACGLAFGPEGWLYVGDRSGTVFRVNAAGRVHPFATLPPSVAAFHLAVGPDEALYVSAPTLSSSDVIYRIDRRGETAIFAEGFGRPQGLAFSREGTLYVVDALAGVSGLYRVTGRTRRELVLSGVGLVGVAFHPDRGFAVASGETAYRLAVDP
jgi:sugar lactone lactonase YvrE